MDIDKMKARALAADSSPAAWPFHDAAFRKVATPAAVLELIAEVERYRWLKARFTGYDFYWGGTPPYDEEKGKCVIVFECGEGFNAGRNFEAGIDAAIGAHTKAGKENVSG